MNRRHNYSSHPSGSRGGLWILAAGAVLGALSFAGMQQGIGVNSAVAQSAPILSDAAPRQVTATTAESLAEIRNLDTTFANLAEFVSPAVVFIRAERGRATNEQGERMPMARGQGSGFIFRKDGYILTNDHVAGGFDRVTVVLQDGREFPGKVTRGDSNDDLAIIKIDADDLPTLAFADSASVRPGQFVMAVGSPFGLQQSVTIGHVSALGRFEGIQNKMYPDLIQTDAAINMGNSGGPLVNIEGQVVGMNTAILSPNGTSAGIGFAIPASQIRLVADILIRDGKLTRSMMGLIPDNLKPYRKKELGIEGGAVVERVNADSPASRAGLQVGDIVLRVGESPIRSQTDLRNSLLRYRPDTEVEVEYLRGRDRRTTKVKLMKFEPPTMPTGIPMPQPREGDGQIPEGFREFFRDFERRFGEGEGPRGQNESQDEPPLRSARPQLGVTVENISDAMRSQFEIPANVRGVVVTSVVPGSPAARVGIRLGDVVTKFGSRTITGSQDLVEEVRKLKAGDRRTIETMRFAEGSRSVSSNTVTF